MIVSQSRSRYVTDDPEKMHYITFISDMATAKDISGGKVYDDDDDSPPQTIIDYDDDEPEPKGRLSRGKRSPAQTKVGINPLSRYDTPNGIYTYPLTPEMFKTLLDGRIGGHRFAQRSPFVALLKPKDYSKVLQLQARDHSDDGYDSLCRFPIHGR